MSLTQCMSLGVEGTKERLSISPVDIWKQNIQVNIATLECNCIAVHSQLVFGHVDNTRAKCLEHRQRLFALMREMAYHHLNFEKSFITIVQ